MGGGGRRCSGADRIGQPAVDGESPHRSGRLGDDDQGDGRCRPDRAQGRRSQEPGGDPRRRRDDQHDMRHLPRKVFALVLFLAVFSAALGAHGVAGKDAVYLQGLQERAVGPLMYLGAKHMVTGYDHLLFLVGVIFFLYRLKDVVMYVSLFTIGHSVTLLGGVLGGIHANPFLIDAVIGFSVIYKAFENMDGFKRFLGVQPNTRVAVLVFGLFHGFGLATKLQEFALSPNGLVANIVSFNVGVEIGQGLALTAILIALTYWRTRSGFMRHAFAANAIVMTGGFLLIGYQLSGYFLGVA